MEKADIRGIIQHDGTVESIGINEVVVRITAVSACSGCHAEGACSIAGKEEKKLTIPGSYNLSPGDRVSVQMQQAMGYKAVILGYLIPFIILIASLIILIAASVDELAAGLISVSVLLPYYFIIYLLRNRINKSFTFKIKTS